MSDYGKLFQEVSDVRQNLKRLIPGASVNMLGEAIREAAAQNRLIQQELSRWADLEREMAQCDDITGMKKK